MAAAPRWVINAPPAQQPQYQSQYQPQYQPQYQTQYQTQYQPSYTPATYIPRLYPENMLTMHLAAYATVVALSAAFLMNRRKRRSEEGRDSEVFFLVGVTLFFALVFSFVTRPRSEHSAIWDPAFFFHPYTYVVSVLIAMQPPPRDASRKRRHHYDFVSLAALALCALCLHASL
jgi:hypothetical protein